METNVRSAMPRSLPERWTGSVSAEAVAIEFAEYVDDDVSPEPLDQSAPSNIAVASDPGTPSVERPTWLKRKASVESPRSSKKSRSAKSVAAPLVTPVSTPTNRDEELTLQQRFQRWWQSPNRGACLASTIGHVVLLVLLSLFAMGQQKRSSEPFTTIISEPDSGPIQFTGVFDLSEVASGGSKGIDTLLENLDGAALRSPFSPELTMNAADIALGASGKGANGDGKGKGVGDNQGDGFADGEGFLFKMPKGGKAVQKGSFAAWTVPEDPQPRESYMIVIRIKLPVGTKQYRVSDLTGTIVGTDGFALQIPYDRTRTTATVTERGGKVVPVKLSDFLPIVDEYVQLMVNVPGASERVRDVIDLKSKLLKESQKLEIVF